MSGLSDHIDFATAMPFRAIVKVLLAIDCDGDPL